MAQIHIGFERGTAGSAARQAEQEAKASGTPRMMRVQAGSAARAAEEAKRAGLDGHVGGASFSLRAEGGRVQRLGAETCSATESIREVTTLAASPGDSTGTQAAPPHSLDVHAAGVRPVEVASGTASPRTAPSPDVTTRLTSFIRGLFLPEEPSQPML